MAVIIGQLVVNFYLEVSDWRLEVSYAINL